MRNYFLIALFAAGCCLALSTPMVGILLWSWVTMMNGHQLAYGFMKTLPLNMIVAVLTLLAVMLRPGPKLPPMQSLTVFFALFFVWCNITTVFALDHNIAMHRWDLSIKSMIFGFFVAMVLNTQLRVRAMLWMFVIAYGYYGVKGGGFTIITGGSGNVVGPPTSSIHDRNQLALVMLMSLPLMNYLRLTSTFKLTRLALYAATTLTAISVIGSFSRGGLIGLLAMGTLLWWKSKSKIPMLLAAMAVVGVVFTVMPDTWFSRMETIDTAVEEDKSFLGRLQAWQFAINAASARVTGVGFSVTENVEVYNQYSGGQFFLRGRAAHSIYFQVLGDHGYPGLILFLTILALVWRTAGVIGSKRNANIPGLEWAPLLGDMIKVSLVGYAVGGAALSMAYDSSICALIGLAIGARYVVEKRRKEYAKELGPAFHRTGFAVPAATRGRALAAQRPGPFNPRPRSSPPSSPR